MLPVCTETARFVVFRPSLKNWEGSYIAVRDRVNAGFRIMLSIRVTVTDPRN